MTAAPIAFLLASNYSPIPDLNQKLISTYIILYYPTDSESSLRLSISTQTNRILSSVNICPFQQITNAATLIVLEALVMVS